MIMQPMMSGGRKDMATVRVVIEDRSHDWEKIELEYPAGTVVATILPGETSAVFDIPFSTSVTVPYRICRDNGDVDTGTMRFATEYSMIIKPGKI